MNYWNLSLSIAIIIVGTIYAIIEKRSNKWLIGLIVLIAMGQSVKEFVTGWDTAGKEAVGKANYTRDSTIGVDRYRQSTAYLLDISTKVDSALTAIGKIPKPTIIYKSEPQLTDSMKSLILKNIAETRFAFKVNSMNICMSQTNDCNAKKLYQEVMSFLKQKGFTILNQGTQTPDNPVKGFNFFSDRGQCVVVQLGVFD